MSTLDTVGIPDAAHGLLGSGALAGDDVRVASQPANAGEQRERGGRDAPDDERRATAARLAERPSPIWPPIPPAFDTIESKETTVARCSEGTTWCR